VLDDAATLAAISEVPGDRRRGAIDLCATLVVFAIGSLALPVLNPLLRRGGGLGGALALAAYQFSLEGLAPTILILWHRERLSDFGLSRRGLWRSLSLAVALAVLYDAALSLRAGRWLWVPLARQPAVRMSLESVFPANLVGLAVVVAVWGAAEGFFGVYFWRKVSAATQTNPHGWLAPGVLAFALFNGVVHLFVGQGIVGFVESFASGYAIAVIPAVTGNAWGGLLVQTLTNAAGAAS